MNNSKMIQTAKNLDIFANVLQKIAAGAGIACVIIAFCVLLFGGKVFATGAITLDLDFLKLHLTDTASVNETFLKLYAFTATLGGGILCFLLSYVSRLFREILSPMKAGRPFEPEIAVNLRKIGVGILIGGFLSELVKVGSRILLIHAYSIQELFSSAAISKTEFIFTINLNFVILTCMMFFLSYIFTYGQALQQDSDETL